MSSASCPCDEAAVLWSVAFWYPPVIHPRYVVCNKFVSSALQQKVIYCHLLNSNQIVQCRDFPTVYPSKMTKNASRPEQIELNKCPQCIESTWNIFSICLQCLPLILESTMDVMLKWSIKRVAQNKREINFDGRLLDLNLQPLEP
jgi:hypothetical protein